MRALCSVTHPETSMLSCGADRSLARMLPDEVVRATGVAPVTLKPAGTRQQHICFNHCGFSPRATEGRVWVTAHASTECSLQMRLLPSAVLQGTLPLRCSWSKIGLGPQQQ
jgi:hypothetical protein